MDDSAILQRLLSAARTRAANLALQVDALQVELSFLREEIQTLKLPVMDSAEA